MNPDVTLNCKVIDQLVDAYNAHDAMRFSKLFAADGWHGNLHAASFQIGTDAIYRRYVEVFSMYPDNRTEVVHRIAFDHFVIDHEKVSRSTRDTFPRGSNACPERCAKYRHIKPNAQRILSADYLVNIKSAAV